jgi:outer membrane lipoprotein SlyB
LRNKYYSLISYSNYLQLFGVPIMKFSAWIISLFFVVSLVGCSSNAPREHHVRNVYSAPKNAERYGRVTDIEVLSVESRPSGGGAVLGAVIGGVLGHQFGKGKGRDVATGAGVIGGAMAGNSVERRNGHDSDIYRITVKFENGSRQQFDYENIDDLRVGDRVRVEDGQLERL